MGGACHLEGGLVSKPIPHVHFGSEFGPGAKHAFKNIDRCLEIIGSGTGGSWSAYTDFIKWLAWGCGAANEKPNFNDKTNEELYRTFNLKPFLTLGSGRQLMYASNYSVRLYGMDIDSLVVKICLINGAMFAPWMSFPFPHKWFERHDAARLQKPDGKFVLAEEYENKMLAAKILEKLKIKLSKDAVN